MANPRTKQHSTSLAPTQVWEENVRKTPMSHIRSRRPVNMSCVTTSFGGKFVPLKAVGFLREDSGLRTSVNVNLQMDETSKMLLNPVRISAMAYFVPKLAFDRFQDMGTIDRSYNSEQEIDGSVVPWFEQETDFTKEFYKVLGLHKTAAEANNTDYLEAYNQIWNYIATQRSPSLTPRSVTDGTIAPAFWEHTQMKHVKPKFDDALLEGTVPLQIVSGAELAVKSLGAAVAAGGGHYHPTSANTAAPPYEDSVYDWTGAIWSELEADSVTVSLANIDLARQTTAWARMRSQYQGISEEWMIDQLMKGIRIRDESLRHPILIDHGQTSVGMTQRYATDAANLQESVTDGRTGITLNLQVPQTTCGGVMMICAQALPEQLYERQRDYYLMAQTVDDLPDRQADELDPQPVVMVQNKEVDEAHTLPDDLFGYAPLNHNWQMRQPNIGGRYYRPDPTAPWEEDRNRIWTPEVIDPTLGPDFYLSTDLSHSVFVQSVLDPFEWWVNGDMQIEGLTYFGPGLRESEGDYDAVLESVDTARLKGDGTDTPTANAEEVVE